MHSKKKIFVIAGEISGDQLGATFLNNIKKSKKVELHGIGGSKLLKLGLIPIFNMDRISVMGLIEVIPKIPELLFLINFTIKKIIEINPDLIITIDSPGFNFRVLKKLNKIKPNLQNIHIVAPSVWAWKASRAKSISAYVNNLFVLFPFEKKYFIPHGIKTHFIGHPLVEIIKSNNNFSNNYKKKYISIFPGSRRFEIINHLELILGSISEVSTNHDYLVVAVENHISLIETIIKKYKLNKLIKIIPRSRKEEAINNSILAIAVSGTITLELALNKIPFFTVYKLNFLSYFFLKNLVFVKYITLVNIIFNKQIVPELIQKKFNKDNIKKYLFILLKKEKDYKYQLEKFKELENLLKNNNKLPSYLASNLIKKILEIRK
ncbi:MAG: lipid-A-disaccharide synthase [Pelagibacterales bacterium]|nr:lipid-A-disaccharide synthase [Pelagibacterales bacterium]OUU63575.1 MAG: lipid-A-disaccharide synthase [Alphaproteobacteria bacterium TMED62]|tara:strand:- start:763 stop:1896 length:1134 start_codon:yes stop_codon:yes gene_type:complete